MRSLYSICSPVSSSRMTPANSIAALVELMFVGSVWSIVSWTNSWVIVHVICLALVLSASQSGACAMSASSCVMKHGWDPCGSVGEVTIVGSVVDATIFLVQSVADSLVCTVGECVFCCRASFDLWLTVAVGNAFALLFHPVTCCI